MLNFSPGKDLLSQPLRMFLSECLQHLQTPGCDGVVEDPVVHSHTYSLLKRPYPVANECQNMKINLSAQLYGIPAALEHLG